MKQNARITAQSRNFILYILIALMVVTGALSQPFNTSMIWMEKNPHNYIK